MSKLFRERSLPPHIAENDHVILFDGVCKLCNVWSKFIIKYDKQRVFKLATVQSKQGQAILTHFDMPTDTFATMLLVQGNAAVEKSTAVLNIVALLPYPLKILVIFWIFPKILRDWMYDRIALNRYKLFGKYDHCLLPTQDHEKRFL